ncbi:ABC transporter ATP-binding protein [Cellulomonas fimi]|uniref:ABC transporter related protein n=1 Tax=Cellulomonas fimi (strain ATCC 484 / DSM 20113 / JCM 1341 / CCUG 24087 / LMG 16345 / NBRC 15513 / NCIMB 8980 / NCTC 7547 / NRS-133) TaxID=590998 RepID=F4H1V4_CELFA|nr:ABC transporter ATP-binding protein [Cellulomonas fimi]AEE47524.1 ABC transporter related protein [Cellulomonas fimi ATCC 484]NNH05498.1 ABC transporter ATP-binding protein [Cellulomonas fimi]
MTSTVDDDTPGGGPPPVPAPVPTPQAPDAADGIVVAGLRRAFGTVQALDGVDLRARAGRVTALVGPNGSGKTTLLLVLAGLLVPDQGSVRVAGHDPVTDGAAARGRTGWMPDAFGTWDSLTAREVLSTFAAAYRIPRAQADQRVAELLATVHLEEYADRPASVLSRGQKQRLGLARALVHSPDVLLLDEPASGLDPRSRVDLRLLLRRLADEGRTVLVSSHVLSELEEMADDAVFLSKGRTVVGGWTETSQAAAPRRYRVRSLSTAALTDWLGRAGVAWQADDEDGAPAGAPDPAASTAPPDPAAPDTPAGPIAGDRPGGAVVDVADDEDAARLLREAVTAGVPVTAFAPVRGRLEQAYLDLDEERR